MIGTIRRPMRGLLTLCVTLALAAAACGGSSSVPNIPGGALPSVPGGGGGGGGGNSLTSGLASNLDNLNSYQFSETISGSSFGAQATSDASGTTISGTVINKPDKRLWINYAGSQIIVIGTQQWMSSDGTDWTSVGTSTSSFSTFLPTTLYGTWFDSFASGYKSAGDDTQNGIACVHYKGDSSINSMYGALAGVQGSFTADLWVAKDGGFPVKGVLGYTATAGGQGGTFGYTLDVTHVNDSSNAVAEPSVAPLPS
jgi:hypothetical protein